jgi:transcriptional antiterminator RfaH
MSNREDWYLVRTKPGKERWVQDQLGSLLPEVFLPLLEAKTPRWGKMTWTTTPLFPCYLFARFDLHARYFDVKYLPGVNGFVSAGNDPLAVPEEVVLEIRRRGVEGVIKIEQPVLGRGERVQIVEGPFRGLEAVFERYLSGAERVAILLNTIEASGVRMVLPAAAVAKYS